MTDLMDRMNLTELAAKYGISPSLILKYIRMGLMGSSLARGPRNRLTFTAEDADRLEFILLLRDVEESDGIKAFLDAYDRFKKLVGARQPGDEWSTWDLTPEECIAEDWAANLEEAGRVAGQKEDAIRREIELLKGAILRWRQKIQQKKERLEKADTKFAGHLLGQLDHIAKQIPTIQESGKK